MNLTLELVVSLLAAAGSFVGALAVGSYRLNRVEKDMGKMQEKIDHADRETIEIRRDLHAARNAAQVESARQEHESAELRAAVDKLGDRIGAIAEGVAEIRAAVKAKE